MRRAGVSVTSRTLQYHWETIEHPDASTEEILVWREKGIDLRLGLDVVRLARNDELDVAVIFSQDQDLAEVALEIRDIGRSTGAGSRSLALFRLVRRPHRSGGPTAPIGTRSAERCTTGVSIRGTTGHQIGRASPGMGGRYDVWVQISNRCTTGVDSELAPHRTQTVLNGGAGRSIPHPRSSACPGGLSHPLSSFTPPFGCFFPCLI